MKAFDAAAYVAESFAAGCDLYVIVDRDGKRMLGVNIADANDIPDAPQTIEDSRAVAEIVEGMGHLLDLSKEAKAD